MAGYIKKDYVNLLSSALSSGDADVHDVELCDRRFRFDKIEVVTFGAPFMSMEYTCDKEYVTAWKLDVGGIFLKDMKKKAYDVYSEVTAVGKVQQGDVSIIALIRRVTPDIEEFVNSSKVLVTVEIGDYRYIIMKVVPYGSSYMVESSFTECIIEQDIDEMYASEYSGDDQDDDNADPLYIDESSDAEYNFFDED